MGDFEHIPSPVQRVIENLARMIDEKKAEANADLAKHDDPSTRDKRDLFNYETKALEAQDFAERIARWERLRAQGFVK